MSRQFTAFGLVIALLVIGNACGESEPEGPPTFSDYPPLEIESKRVYTVVITTNLGRMTFNLNTQEAPLAANSLVFLARQGFYDGMTVHRLLPGVLAETGDPTGSGDGGPGYAFEIEPPHRPYVPGDLVMANAGTPDSNGSRFFIILGDVSANGALPPDYTLVGQIKANHKPSFKTLENIGAVAVGSGLHGEMSAPQDQITIVSLLATEGCKATGAFTYKCL